MNWKIEHLDEKHDCRRFRCGEHILDNFLLRHALVNDRRGLGRTYVAIDDPHHLFVTVADLRVSGIDRRLNSPL